MRITSAIDRSVVLGARHHSVTILSFLALLACCTRTLAAQATHDTQNQDAQASAPTAAVFAEIFNRVWRASSEADPFRSIRGDFDPAFPGWFATAILPGAYQCHVYKSGGWMQAGTGFEAAAYDCNFQVLPEDNERSFAEMVHTIRSLLPNLELREFPPPPALSGHWGVTSHRLGGRSIVMALPSDESEARRYPKALCFQPRLLGIEWSNSTRVWHDGKGWSESGPIAGLHLRLGTQATLPRDQASICPGPYLIRKSAQKWP